MGSFRESTKVSKESPSQLMAKLVTEVAHFLADDDCSAAARELFREDYRRGGNLVVLAAFDKYIENPPRAEGKVHESSRGESEEPQYLRFLTEVVRLCVEKITLGTNEDATELAIKILALIPPVLEVAPDAYAELILYQVSHRNFENAIDFLMLASDMHTEVLLKKARSLLVDEQSGNSEHISEAKANWGDFINALYAKDPRFGRVKSLAS